VRFGYYFDPKNPDEIQVISSYGRFNYPGKKSNIAQGGGVVDIKVVQDDKYQESKMKMLETVFSLEKQDGQFFQDRLSENLQNDNLTYKGKSMAMSPLPFIISESAFERMKAAALQVAKNLKSDKPFMFALDAFLNPSPIEYTNST
jgi:predicted ferric reductase